ncbi:unnamed protein product [Meganyctiphanes norvegica]|uniref:Uncharacterized protein n=1 Tax=Meganyctiphanes norvegica TaxID=48144 RepID=A0AAV2QXB1_MEGNR
MIVFMIIMCLVPTEKKDFMLNIGIEKVVAIVITGMMLEVQILIIWKISSQIVYSGIANKEIIAQNRIVIVGSIVSVNIQQVLIDMNMSDHSLHLITWNLIKQNCRHCQMKYHLPEVSGLIEFQNIPEVNQGHL